jgi:tRNA G18 (ribose-2'-O)-methylase SpoU
MSVGNRRGYFEIGIARAKTETNIGTLWRSAYQLGAAGIFTIGRRYKRQSSDTTQTWRHIPLREYCCMEDFLNHRPYSCQIVGIEMGGRELSKFVHPEQCCYLLGAEDSGLSSAEIAKCNMLVSLSSIRTNSFNVSVAGSLVMYDRFIKLGG